MTFLLLLPTILCALIMAAHFLRDWALQASMGASAAALLDLFLLAMSLILPFILIIRTRYVLRAMQALLILAAIDLLFTGYKIMQDRIAEGNSDVIPPGIIMGATACFCLLAAALYQTRRLKAHYPVEYIDE